MMRTILIAIGLSAIIASEASAQTTIQLNPTSDVYTEGGSVFNGSELRIEPGSRVAYLRFDLSVVTGPITAAEIRLKHDISPDTSGSGTINVNLGSHAAWDESSTSNELPGEGLQIGTLNTTYAGGATYTWPLTGLVGQSPAEPISLIMTMVAGGNDAFFSSKEGDQAPVLEITYNASGPFVDLTASATEITAGQSITLSWDSTNAGSCTGTNFNTGTAADGQVAAAPTVTTVYAIDCDGAQDSVTVTVSQAQGETTTSLEPTDDVFIEGSAISDTGELRINPCVQIGYLRFDLSAIPGVVTAARLKLTQATDAGTGTINVFLGSHANWTEATLTGANRPNVDAQVGSLTSPFSGGTTYEWELSQIPSGGALTLIVLMGTGGDAAWFSSREDANAAVRPVLEVTHGAIVPLATLSANPTTVEDGQQSTLTWGSTNADTCTASQSAGTDFSTAGATSGTDSVTPTAPSTTYTVTCTNASGSDEAQVIVSVNTGGGGFVDDTYCEAAACPGTPRIDNTDIAYEYQNGGGDSYGTGLVFNSSDGAIWDSRGSTWKFNNCRNDNPTNTCTCSCLPGGETENQISKLPILVRGTNNGRWQGGNVNGLNPLDEDWNESYWNAVGMRVDTSTDFTVEGIRFDRVWDGIKFVDGAQDYLLKDSWISRARDDCVETGGAHSGVIRDSLFEGCFAGFDSDPGNDYTGPSREATELQQFHGVLMRMQTYLYQDTPRQGHLFKTHDSSPSISMHNSVLAPSLALQTYSRTQRAWQRMTNAYGSCSNNLFLWLGSGSTPSGFLTGMPACFTVVEGQAAQDAWAAARQNWIDCHPAITRATDVAGDGIPPNDPASNSANCVKGTWGGYD